MGAPILSSSYACINKQRSRGSLNRGKAIRWGDPCCSSCAKPRLAVMNRWPAVKEKTMSFGTLRSRIMYAVLPLAMLTGYVSAVAQSDGNGNSVGNRQDGKRLFERETFAGNGRTCLTCHTRETGTISPSDA